MNSLRPLPSSPLLLLLLLVVACFWPVTVAQYPPPASYDTNLTSPINPHVTITYKQPQAGTCMTAFSSQQQYTGYVSLPPYTLAPIQQNYSVNTFFWFIEARQTPELAPLTIWLNGGPGSSSMVGLFEEVGPCEVVQTMDGTFGTQARTWGWDRSSNLLFIDQPNQVGFSFDTATNATFDLFANAIFGDSEDPISPDLPDFMYKKGTFGTASEGDDDYTSTANTTDIAAQTTWHFLQTWLAAFPQYNPALRPNTTSAPEYSEPAGIHLFAESYGGKYGPVFAAHFEEQNERRLNGTIQFDNTVPIRLESLGIMNGMVDDLIQDYYFPLFAYNNTYGIEAISQTDQLNALSQYSGTDGCMSQINACRAAMQSTDPQGYGNVEATNERCMLAQYTCNNLSSPLLAPSGYSPYDIRQQLPTSDPPAAYQEYLNNETVLAAIGARVNYTESNRYVQAAFISTGDTIRGGQLKDIAYLLSQGVRVGLIYGDSDYLCNWYGGQAVSLAVADMLPDVPSQDVEFPGVTPPAPPYSVGFPEAGYAEIVVNNTYVGGAVRQFGNLSFSRIYGAGHLVPYYQPETAFTVFSRIIQGTEISTGEAVDLSTFGSVGPANSTYENTLPSQPDSTCWIRSFNSSCSEDQVEMLLGGDGVAANGIFYSETASLPETTVTVGVPGHPMTTSSGMVVISDDSGTPTTVALLGVYTATATPSPSEDAAASLVRPRGDQRAGIAWMVVTVAASVAAGVLVML
ncbi:hypothetical protein MBLNU230_g4377t1 [Neophaeotheca triangularis]